MAAPFLHFPGEVRPKRVVPTDALVELPDIFQEGGALTETDPQCVWQDAIESLRTDRNWVFRRLLRPVRISRNLPLNSSMRSCSRAVPNIASAPS